MTNLKTKIACFSDPVTKQEWQALTDMMEKEHKPLMKQFVESKKANVRLVKAGELRAIERRMWTSFAQVWGRPMDGIDPYQHEAS